MKELIFIDRNSSRWKEFESVIQSKVSVSPDKISDLFIQLTDDLAYARTYYPDRPVTSYLNNLTISVHHRIYQNKKVKKNRLSEFWLIDYPLLLKANMRFIYYALIIFIISAIIGVVSAANDNSFVRLILGDSYVNMTLDNIHKGDPLAVYKQANPTGMFLGITLNNLYVAFRTVVMGVFLSIGSGYSLFSNGIMVGAFQSFFFQHGLLKESILTIYIHGTFELFSIVMAGAAGFMIGSGILFPGNYKRIDSFKRGVRNGARILIGIVPIFIVAAFLEGFVTRNTQWPDIVRASIIGLSLLTIIVYFFIYPQLITKHLITHGTKQN
ncbi:MAG: stage II sporulation protein M [Bacteroidota bacterium]|nr:stage II sporulation protein M [Bacteroidota bacterium]